MVTDVTTNAAAADNGATSADNVVTPCDDRAAYAPDWRAQLACVLHRNGRNGLARVHNRYRDDPYVSLYARYLAASDARKNGNPEFDTVSRILRWRVNTSSHTAARLEALLLTEAPMAVIAAHVDGPGAGTAAFECYERLFFNCRGPRFEPCGSDALKSAFANVPVEFADLMKAKAVTEWRAIAANFGYEALIAAFRWAGPEQAAESSDRIRKAVVGAMQGNMIARVAMKRVTDFDAAGWVKSDAEITAARLKAEAGEAGAVEIAKIIQTLLGYTAPKPLVRAAGADVDAEIDRRLKTSDEVTPGSRADAAGGDKALDALITKAFGQG